MIQYTYKNHCKQNDWICRRIDLLANNNVACYCMLNIFAANNAIDLSIIKSLFSIWQANTFSQDQLTRFQSAVFNRLSHREDALDEDSERPAGGVASPYDGEAERFLPVALLEGDRVVGVRGGPGPPRQRAKVGRVRRLNVALGVGPVGGLAVGVVQVDVAGAAERERVLVPAPVAHDLSPEQLVVHAAVARVLPLQEVRVRVRARRAVGLVGR